MFRLGNVNAPGSGDWLVPKAVLSRTLVALLTGNERVFVFFALAGEGFGARIEIRTLLNDDAGARAPVLVAAGEHRMAAGVVNNRLLLRGCIGRHGQQADRRGSRQGGDYNLEIHGFLAP